ncbi:MAG TPA: tRNA isopentenyl-2-thiomethyl-A-37 hydroxylase MiaE [Phycisphaerae bacterium]|nr:tRNA isopentenyl-2-thiomethyl-A-37 hydroxylase MiaE [Phycisphaerae bacterium]
MGDAGSAVPLELLNDHAHLEKKAATNALELLHRWPEPSPPENRVAAMTAGARDEVEHLAVVCRLLSRRGGRLTKSHSNPYASALHGLARKGAGVRAGAELVDRLLISALVEVRSCERFLLLSRACADEELARLYRALWASEHGHYLSFLQLAQKVQGAEEVERRWEEMLEAEAGIIRGQGVGPRMHSGVRSGTTPPRTSRIGIDCVRHIWRFESKVLMKTEL